MRDKDEGTDVLLGKDWHFYYFTGELKIVLKILLVICILYKNVYSFPPAHY